MDVMECLCPVCGATLTFRATDRELEAMKWKERRFDVTARYFAVQHFMRGCDKCGAEISRDDAMKIVSSTHIPGELDPDGDSVDHKRLADLMHRVECAKTAVGLFDRKQDHSALRTARKAVRDYLISCGKNPREYMPECF